MSGVPLKIFLADSESAFHNFVFICHLPGFQWWGANFSLRGPILPPSGFWRKKILNQNFINLNQNFIIFFYPLYIFVQNFGAQNLELPTAVEENTSKGVGGQMDCRFWKYHIWSDFPAILSSLGTFDRVEKICPCHSWIFCQKKILFPQLAKKL